MHSHTLLTPFPLVSCTLVNFWKLRKTFFSYRYPALLPQKTPHRPASETFGHTENRYETTKTDVRTPKMHSHTLLTPFPHVSCTLVNFWKIRKCSIFFVPIPCLATSENTLLTDLIDLQAHRKSLRKNENGCPDTQKCTSRHFEHHFHTFHALW